MAEAAMKMNYVIITPAHNEELFIEKTLGSVIMQSVLPMKWLIVSDGSTDRTVQIVEKYAAGRKWIEIIRLPERKDRHFAAKVFAFNTAYERITDMKYDIIGNVDGDISFESDYFEYLLEQFASCPQLGVAGTHYVEGNFHSFRDSYISPDHVNGQCQLFRRECFEEIGGYTPIRYGGIDWLAVTTARMKGWKTRSFAGRVFIHNRVMGTGGNQSILRARFNAGKKDYFLGGHPLWQVFRGMFQMGKRPYVTGGTLLLLGYIWAWMSRMERPISKDLIKFHRREQLERLYELFASRLRLNRTPRDRHRGYSQTD